MKIQTKVHKSEDDAKIHALEVEEAGGFSKTNYIQQGKWQVRYWFPDDIDKGDTVVLKEETFGDNKPSFFIKNKNVKGVVMSLKFFSKHPKKSVYTLTVALENGETISVNNYHWEKV